MKGRVSDCPFCLCVGVECPARVVDGYSCTRPMGHSGPHVACGVGSHALRLWEDSSDEVFRDLATALDHFATRRPKDCNCKPVQSSHSSVRKLVLKESA